MLTSLRKNKENLMIKFVLLIITLSFVLYFGTSSLRSANQAPTNSVATVNNESISSYKSDFFINSQLDQLKETFKDKLPEQYVVNVKNNIIQMLINQELISQTLNEFGIRVTENELFDFVTNDSRFQRDGKFDVDYYTNRYLPGYQQQTDRKSVV